MTSLLVHLALILVAVFLIQIAVAEKRAEDPPPELNVGGGGGGQSNAANKAKSRQVSMNQPKTRIVSNVATSEVVLPETPRLTGPTSLSAFSMPQGGSGGGEGGKRGGGRGSSLGKGVGQGTGTGSVPGFVAMFGRKIEARKLGVVLDVSKSMAAFLPAVVREANKIGSGAPILCAYGCGLSELKEPVRARARAARGNDFEEFWMGIAGTDLADGTPLKDSYDALNGRKDTYFFARTNVGNTWQALTSSELRDVDAVYWFADFKDPVTEEKMADVVKELQRRKQKLYVHASGGSPASLEMVLEKIVKPTGGELIQADLSPPKTPQKPADSPPSPAKAS